MFVTYVRRSFVCPAWNTEVSLEGKYRIQDDDNGTAYLICVRCPIHESHTPDRKLDYMICNKGLEFCGGASVFQKEITCPYI